MGADMKHGPHFLEAAKILRDGGRSDWRGDRGAVQGARAHEGQNEGEAQSTKQRKHKVERWFTRWMR